MSYYRNSPESDGFMVADDPGRVHCPQEHMELQETSWRPFQNKTTTVKIKVNYIGLL